MSGSTVRLTEAVRDEVVAHARAEAPNECCGLLIGMGDIIDEAVRARNIDPNPATRYLVDPSAHVAVLRRLRGTQRDVVGCYHSHPRSPAVPSPTDRAEAYYPDFVYLIVSLQSNEPELAAYRLTDDGMERHRLLMVPAEKRCGPEGDHGHHGAPRC